MVLSNICKKKGLTTSDIHVDRVAILGDDAPALSTPQKWTAEFRRGMESLEGDPRPGCPVTGNTKENIDHIRHMVMDNKQLTINQITNAISISCDGVENILHNQLGMTKVSTQ
ncbi:uncharacterized protein LOC115212223 [Octopus sinensis]|uniref:Uncharacterized protein LOC115212223 n=1 Tax=Octopus sinensis TaxID=2607531 RepID=A0A6P7SEY8_9MOLL|nr:uncharacterized protein LOC115212223 [Octopus sinensis]